MTKRFVRYVLLAALACSGMVQAQVDLSGLDNGMAGPRSQVLVLGSEHLSTMPKDFKPESLEPLLARLAAFKPDIITIEGIPGESCAMMARYPTIYEPASVEPYCLKTEAARAATGLDVPSAIALVQKTLNDWPAQPTSAQRRHLAALFMAANDDPSALTQWLQVPQTDQHTGDGLNDALVKRLNSLSTKHNEDYLIAAHLAARLGLQRVYPVDDHTGDNIQIPDSQEKAFGAAIQHAWNTARATRQPTQDQENTLKKAGDMLALYRYLNRPDVLRNAIEADMGAALRDPSPQHYGQMYVAGWETRNLRMVANVRAAFREKPGARVLCIVGATHKPWFDSLLGQMQGVDIVDVEKVLGAAPK
ncbi:MAG: DUF5694 domain-containing protein [Rhodanobacteraceae bacterium]